MNILKSIVSNNKQTNDSDNYNLCFSQSLPLIIDLDNNNGKIQINSDTVDKLKKINLNKKIYTFALHLKKYHHLIPHNINKYRMIVKHN